MSGTVSGYQEVYVVYAKRYKVSERTIKRWVELGKSESEKCPLDEPMLMRDWWGKVRTQASRSFCLSFWEL